MADSEFAHLMAMHHGGGIEMTKMEESAGASAEVKALAAKIRQGQERDLPTLAAEGKKSSKPSAMVATHEKAMHKEHATTMVKMKSAKGAALDKVFVDEMIKHHESALEMIKQSQLKDATLKALADKMAEAQRGELDELRKLQRG